MFTSLPGTTMTLRISLPSTNRCTLASAIASFSIVTLSASAGTENETAAALAERGGLAGRVAELEARAEALKCP